MSRRLGEVNEWLGAADDRQHAVLRTRLASAIVDDAPADSTALVLPRAYGREVYAVVSERYGTGCEVDVLARELQMALRSQVLPGDARAEITYDGRAVGIRVVWHSNINPDHACAGEVFKTGVSIGAADDRTQSIEVLATILRNLCLNFIILGEAKQSHGKRRHTGDTADLSQWLWDAFSRASRSVRGFALLWDKARLTDLAAITRDIPAGETDREKIVGGVMRGLLQAGKVAMPGVRAEAAVETLTASWKKEPEFARVGVVNAITRAAHETGLRGAFASDAMEAQGGALLTSERPFQYVERGEVF